MTTAAQSPSEAAVNVDAEEWQHPRIPLENRRRNRKVAESPHVRLERTRPQENKEHSRRRWQQGQPAQKHLERACERLIPAEPTR